MLLQKSSTMRFLILRMSSLRRSSSSLFTFSFFYYWGACSCVSWMPSYCSTIVCTWLPAGFDYSSAICFLRYYYFRFRIFSRCYSSRFLR